MSRADGPWNVPTISLSQRLFKVAPGVACPEAKTAEADVPAELLKYTILDETNVYYSADDLAALSSSVDCKTPGELVAYRPQRIALHQALIYTLSHIQLLSDESDLAPKTLEILDRMKPDIEKLTEAFEVKRNEARATAAQPLSHITLLEIDTALQLEINAAMEEAAETAGRTLCDDDTSTITAMAIPAPTERMTYMVAGGIASGKGSSVYQLLMSASKKGIDPSDIAMINGDALKPILLEPGSVAPLLYSQLCTDEATHVKTLLFKRLEQMASEGKAPHSLIDQTGLKQAQVNYALLNEGQLEGIIVSTNVLDAVERSFERGRALGDSGRYENTRLILRNHREKTAAIPEVLASLPGTAAHFTIVDNNVARGEDPTPIAIINILTGSITVLDTDKLQAFIRKVNINTDASGPDEVYEPTTTSTSIEEYLQPLLNRGYTLTSDSVSRYHAGV